MGAEGCGVKVLSMGFVDGELAWEKGGRGALGGWGGWGWGLDDREVVGGSV